MSEEQKKPPTIHSTEEEGRSTREPKTRSEVLGYVLDTSGFDEPEREFIRSKIGIKSIVDIMVTEEESILQYAGEPGFTRAHADKLCMLKKWLMFYTDENDILPYMWTLEYQEDTLWKHATKVARADAAKKRAAEKQPTVEFFPKDDTTVSQVQSSRKGKARISDYPEWNGRMTTFFTFKDKFEGVAETDGMGYILEKDAEDLHGGSEMFEEDSRYIYSILKNVAAGGLAASKIKKYEVTKNGFQAWRDICDHYESMGSTDQFVTEAMSELANLKLEYNSHGGLETYISDFETLQQRLDQAGEVLSDRILKTQFLMGIEDRDFKSSVSFCRMDDSMKLAKTIRTLRADAKAMGKLDGRPQARRSNNSNSNGQENGNGGGNQNGKKKKGNWRLPKEIWNELSPELRENFLAFRRKQRDEGNGPKEQYGGQYSSINLSKSKQEGQTEEGPKEGPKEEVRSVFQYLGRPQQAPQEA